MIRTVYFDIETGPNDIPFDPLKVPIGRIKDPDKILAKIDKARADYPKVQPLHASTGKVLLVSMKAGDKYTDFYGEEEQILEGTWKRLRHCRDQGLRIVGHNIFKFDLPFLRKRTWILGLTMPNLLYNNKYGRWDEAFTDTMLEWEHGNKNAYIGLDDLDKKLGGPGVGSGEDFHKMMEEDREAAIDYCHKDLDATERISDKMGITF